MAGGPGIRDGGDVTGRQRPPHEFGDPHGGEADAERHQHAQRRVVRERGARETSHGDGVSGPHGAADGVEHDEPPEREAEAAGGQSGGHPTSRYVAGRDDDGGRVAMHGRPHPLVAASALLAREHPVEGSRPGEPADSVARDVPRQRPTRRDDGKQCQRGGVGAEQHGDGHHRALARHERQERVESGDTEHDHPQPRRAGQPFHGGQEAVQPLRHARAPHSPPRVPPAGRAGDGRPPAPVRGG